MVVRLWLSRVPKNTSTSLINNPWHINSFQTTCALLLLSVTHTQTQGTDIREAITLGRTAVQSPLAPAEICSAPHPTVSPNISNRHRPAAPCPHHQSVPAPAPLINDDLCRRDRGLRDRGYGAGEGDRCWCFDHPCGATMPQCHTMAGPGLQFKRGRRKRLSSGGRRVGSDLQVQGRWRRVARGTSWKCHTVRCQRAG